MKPLILALLLTGVARASTNEPTVINSDRMQSDYVSNVGTFEGNVVVIDPRLTLRADKMTVFFGGTNNIVNDVTNQVRSIQRITSTGAVEIHIDQKKATCDNADYIASDEKAILTGNPKVETPDGVVTGKKITLWHGKERMDVESDVTDTNRTRLIIYPEEQRKKDE
ncbi:MAG: LptA/OstA family protein [Verrucomicrobiota bacterium]